MRTFLDLFVICFSYWKWTSFWNGFKQNQGDSDLATNEESVTMVDDNKNSFIINISLDNQVDIRCLGNMILKNRKNNQISNNCSRSMTDKYKSYETYEIPKNMFWTQDEIEIELIQTVNLCLIFEIDNESEILADYSLTKQTSAINSAITEFSYGDFYQNVYEKCRWLENTSTLDSLSSRDGFQIPLPSHTGWSSNPKSVLNGNFGRWMTLFYWHKNYELLKAFLLFLYGKNCFVIKGIKYKIIDPNDDDDDKNGIKKFIKSIIEHPDVWECYIKKIETWQGEQRTYLESKYSSCNMETLNKSFKQMISNFEMCSDKMVVSEKAEIKIVFSNPNLNKYDLSMYARKWMNTAVMEYYQRTMNRVGKKVTIYKLSIKYEKYLEDVNNPLHDEWIQQWSKEAEKKKEDDKKKELEKKEAEKKRNEAKNDSNSDNNNNDSDSDDSEITEPSKKPKKKLNKKQQQQQQVAIAAGNRYFNKFRDFDYDLAPLYIPPEPPVTIKKEKLRPIATSSTIKSDRKPLEYLYLPREDKHLLLNYLKNFKDNKHLYEKYGFPYKGGLIMSGLPGCGKSSVILSIATYLEKDIFYLDLGQIRTNEELKLLIDYIKSKSQHGGVIIFEDIDCMSEIVLQRKESQPVEEEITRLNDRISSAIETINDKLSLSFLLNVLDGTLAPEDVMFVMTSNHINKLDKALIRPGRIDINLELKACNTYQLQCIYRDLYEKELDPQLLEQFQSGKFITAQVILHLFHNMFNKNLTDVELLRPFTGGQLSPSDPLAPPGGS